jgi:hypothetical protein
MHAITKITNTADARGRLKLRPPWSQSLQYSQRHTEKWSIADVPAHYDRRLLHTQKLTTLPCCWSNRLLASGDTP